MSKSPFVSGSGLPSTSSKAKSVSQNSWTISWPVLRLCTTNSLFRLDIEIACLLHFHSKRYRTLKLCCRDKQRIVKVEVAFRPDEVTGQKLNSESTFLCQWFFLVVEFWFLSNPGCWREWNQWIGCVVGPVYFVWWIDEICWNFIDVFIALFKLYWSVTHSLDCVNLVVKAASGPSRLSALCCG